MLSAAWCVGEGSLAPSWRTTMGRRELVRIFVALVAVVNVAALPSGAPRLFKVASRAAQLGVFLVAAAPMSCGALVDHCCWQYLTWNDVWHDVGLAMILFGGAVSRWAERKPRGRIIGWVASTSSLTAVTWAWHCPFLGDVSRACSVGLEALALLTTQMCYTAMCVEFAEPHAARDHRPRRVHRLAAVPAIPGGVGTPTEPRQLTGVRR